MEQFLDWSVSVSGRVHAVSHVLGQTALMLSSQFSAFLVILDQVWIWELWDSVSLGLKQIN